MIFPPTALLASESEAVRELPAEPWVIGVTVFAVLCLLLIVTLTFGKDR